jgi:hypothetical protein
VRRIEEELNMNRETVRLIIMDLGMRKIFTKMVPRILTDDYKRWLHISSDLLHNAQMFSIQHRNTIPEHAVANTEFTSAEKSMHVSLTVQDHAFVSSNTRG